MDNNPKSAETEAIVNGLTNPAISAALAASSEQVLTTVSIALYGLTTVLVSYVVKRVLADIIETALKAIELKNALEKK